MTHAPTQFNLLYELIHERTGLRLSDTQQQDLIRLIQNPDVFPALPNLHEFFILLRDQPTDSEAWQSVIRCVTVGETYFFRNQAQFTALREGVLPGLIEKQRSIGAKQLRLWSAGCATGEEPFSLAMLLRDLLPDIDTWHITILATDINSANIERAQRGLYRSWSFRHETPSDLRDRWFTPDEASFQISPVIRRMVDFRLINLTSDDYPSFETGIMNLDLIVCRNVTIYFDQKTTEDIAARFHRALNADGWLVVGHAEPMSAVYQGFGARNFPDTVLYQKVPLPASEAAVIEPTPVFTPAFQFKTTPAPRPNPTPKVEPAREVVPAVVDAWEKARQAADAE